MTDAERAEFLTKLRSQHTLRPDQLVEVPLTMLLQLCELAAQVPVMAAQMEQLQTLVLRIESGGTAQ